MPLTRYQIRNEYSLADPELYRAADKDDPEALLEGVAMAGLVGVLRQLGDLAEFAAEIFHDLHEEVMATATRGHGLMIRVQQLEAEFPSIEKAFLSQTNHTSFFSNSGVEWHPNLRMEQNLVTRGDLPRCVMDSYEECRGPPRLFLLDKFDVAGAGACLKRYTDPSFFKVEAASSEIPSVEGQREKKIRKVKKKGSRWRNGETPEIVPTSHAKLHQLFLEERVEKGQSDPARLVKLKKRQLNASPFDSRSGKSYMEKFLESSPESNVVHEVIVNPLPLKLTSDNSSESGLEIYDINTISPVKKSSQGKESICSSPNAQEEVLKPSMEELYGEVIDRQIVKIYEPIAGGETDEVSSILHKETLEKEIAVDGEGKSEGSIDGDQSDDMTSEVDNYMDALATMESEMETDNEYRLKTEAGFSNVKHGTVSDRNEEQLDFEANFSDSQSVGNFSASDEGNGSSKKGRSSVSYSDTHSNLAENTPSEGEGGAKISDSLGTIVPEIKETPSDQLPVNMEIQGTKSRDLLLPTDTCIDEYNNADFGESYCNSSSMDPSPILLPSDPETSSLQNKLDETPSESVRSVHELSNFNETESNLVDSSAVVSDMPLQAGDDIRSEVCAESHPVDEKDDGDPNVSSDGLSHVSNNLELVPEKKSGDYSGNEVVQTDVAGDNSTESMVDESIGSPQSVTSTAAEQFHYSTMPEVEVDSGFTSLLDSSDVVKHADLASVDDTFPSTEVYLENSTSVVNSTEVHLENSTSQTDRFKDQQFSDISDSVPEAELDSTEKAALSSEEEAKLEDISRTADSEKVGAFTCKVDEVEGGALSVESPSNCPVVSVFEDLVGLHDVVAEDVVETENMAVSATSIAAPSNDFLPISAEDNINDIVCSSPNIICSASSDLVNLQESCSGIEDGNKEEWDIDEPISPECARGSEAEKETSQLDVSSKDVDPVSCKLVSFEDSNLEMVDGVDNSSLAETNRNSLPAGDVNVVPASSEPSDQEVVLENPHLNILVEDREDVMSSCTGNLPDPVSSLEESRDWQAEQHDAENVKAEESISRSSNHLSEQVQSPNHKDQGRCFNDASVSCEDLSSQHSPSEYVPQSIGNEIKSTEQATDPISTAFPGFGLLNGATQVIIEEMPPLPPLPPMQWRLGKFQHGPLFSQGEVSEHSQESFPSTLPLRDNEKVQIGFQAPQRGITPSGNPFLSLAAFEVEESHASEQVVGNELQPSLSSLQLPTMVNDANSQQNIHALEETQSLNPFSTLSAFPNGKSEYNFIASERETVQSSSNPFLPKPTVENTAPRYDSDASQGNLTHPPNQLASEAAFALEYTSQNSEEEDQNPSNTSVVPPRNVDEQPQHNLPTSERESSWSSNSFALKYPSQKSEEEHQNPSDTSVLPPRKIDEQPQHNLPTSERESSWLSNSFALQHTSQNSDEQHWNSSNTFVLPPIKFDEQPQHGLPTLEREPSWSSNSFALLPTSEVGKTNGSSVTKLPRPRNPLIDAVAALDKSKLRKVTERDRPQNAPKVDERDSLLEQIRTKSFNLKPAVVTRPSIQGPTTNLTVAAILEKAIAIRQATAGSDEDDEDGWSDS